MWESVVRGVLLGCTGFRLDRFDRLLDPTDTGTHNRQEEY